MKKPIYSIVLFYALGLLGAVAASLAYTTYARASVTDDRIESSAKNSYVFKTYLKDDSINVESKNGVVTLTGTVSEESHKSLAKETVASLPKVRSVENRLEVKGERPEEHSDGWITMKVKTNLMFHKHVSFGKTEVTTTKGIVTLKGEADSSEQKNLTTDYAKDVEGVKDVRNEMTVAKTSEEPAINKRAHPTKGEHIDDASITGQVKLSLFSHRSTSALNTKVKTNNGVVTLRGTADNEAERELASKLSYDVYGVKNVRNEMTIERK